MLGPYNRAAGQAGLPLLSFDALDARVSPVAFLSDSFRVVSG